MLIAAKGWSGFLLSVGPLPLPVLLLLIGEWWVTVISVAFEHSVLRAWEIYALENVVFCIAIYGPYKP